MFKRTEYGFWKQVGPSDFDYTQEYVEAQSTNPEMVHLRLGWITAALGYATVREARFIDIGAGNRMFEKVAKPLVRAVTSYDVVGNSISKGYLMQEKWDIAIFADVIEHESDLEFLLDVPWKHAYVSFPETPLTATWEELKTWRHFKPDEHVWMLNRTGMLEFVQSHGVEVLQMGNPEDLIRKRENPEIPNITSLMLRR